MVTRHQSVTARLALMGMLTATVVSTSVSAAPAATPCTPADELASVVTGGNAPFELIIPPTITATLTTWSPKANDAPYVLRFTAMVTNAWFDAIAPYHDGGTAVGVYSDLGRRPEEERTNLNRNIATLYASHVVLDSILPDHAEAWDKMLCEAGLDPEDDSDDLTTPVGIGNVAGAAVVEARVNDGMNQLGDYADTTGYQPVNTVDELTDPSRWQPLEVPDGQGGVTSQTFITPQWADVEPYSYDDVDAFTTPPPTDSVPRGRKARDAYKEQLDHVVEVSENLTAEQKLAADFFENKFASLGFSGLAAAEAHDLSLQDAVVLDFQLNVAAFDAGIPIWAQKRVYDAVRPVTAIRYHHSGIRIPGWGGPPRSVDPGLTSWTSYLDTGDHPEYPSGSAGFCAAHAQAARLFFGGRDAFEWEPDFSPDGPIASMLGVVPEDDAALSFKSWTEFETLCGMSRVYGGVHFQPAVDEAQKMTSHIGTLAHEFVQKHLAGDV